MDGSAGLDGAAVQALMEGRHGDPFALLGPHRVGEATVVRTLQPGATAVRVVARDGGDDLGSLGLVHPGGLFAGPVGRAGPYRLVIDWPGGRQEVEDPYAFGLLLGDLDLHLMAQGTHYELGRVLGAQPMAMEGCRACASPSGRRTPAA